MTTTEEISVKVAAVPDSMTVEDTGARTIEVRSGKYRYRVAVREPDARPIDLAARELFVKMPSFLVPSLARPLDVVELEEWIIGSFLVNYLMLHDGQSPPLAHLAELSGRRDRTVMAIAKRLQTKGWLGMAKIRNEYVRGKYGHKWRFWIPSSSPFMDIMGKTSSKPWVPVPAAVARSRSPLAVGAYLALHEQQRIDGAISTTPTDLAGILACAPRTVRRLLPMLGCTPVGKPLPGCAVYTMPLPLAKREKPSGFVEVLHHRLPVYGGEKAVEALQARWNELNVLLDRAHCDWVASFDAMYLVASNDEELTAAAVIRSLEERYRTRLVLDSGYRRRLWKRFASHLRHAKMDRKVRAAKEQSREWRETREAALQTLVGECPDCRGDRLVEADDGFYTACTSCT